MSDNNNISSWLKSGAVAGIIGVAAAAGIALYEEYTKQQQEEEARRNKLRQFTAATSNFHPGNGFDRPRNLPCDSTPSVCVICQENENIHPILILTCGHRFHSECIHDAYKVSNLCPICRQHFTL